MDRLSVKGLLIAVLAAQLVMCGLLIVSLTRTDSIADQVDSIDAHTVDLEDKLDRIAREGLPPRT